MDVIIGIFVIAHEKKENNKQQTAHIAFFIQLYEKKKKWRFFNRVRMLSSRDLRFF